MKLFLVFAIALTFTSQLNAGYLIIKPLEMNNGGNLPQGSIKIINKTIEDEFEYTCYFMPTNSNGEVILSYFNGVCKNGILTGRIGPSLIRDGICNENRYVSFKAGTATMNSQYCP